MKEEYIPTESWLSDGLAWLQGLPGPNPYNRRIGIGPKTREVIEEMIGQNLESLPTATLHNNGWIEVDSHQIKQAVWAVLE